MNFLINFYAVNTKISEIVKKHIPKFLQYIQQLNDSLNLKKFG